VRLPLLLSRGERLRLDVPLPAAVPSGYVHVPAGCFLYGSADDENTRLATLEAAPLHRVCTGAYLIGRTEVTFADWMVFLRSLSPQERQQRLPFAPGGQFGLRLREAGGVFTLELQPTSRRLVAAEGEPIRYPDRHTRAAQDWRLFPVSGVSLDDARAYLEWLTRSGRLPGARLCDEREWERAARGADERVFPHGDRLAPDDANFDETYQRREGGFGPDAVGSHPASASPFGVLDLVGNVMEWTRAAQGPGEVRFRGGDFYRGQRTARANARHGAEPSTRSIWAGLRVCADAQVRGPQSG
jgi:eukaryotic-like serine/threonine-protein kinase